MNSVEELRNVRGIGHGAFKDCNKLESIIIGENVKIIGLRVFNGMMGLKEVILNKNLEKIGRYSFAGAGISSIIIPKNVAEINYAAFYGCQNLKTIIMESQNPPILIKDNIEPDAFKDTPQTKIIYVPDNSVDTYINDSQWSKYERYIKPISEKPKD